MSFLDVRKSPSLIGLAQPCSRINWRHSVHNPVLESVNVPQTKQRLCSGRPVASSILVFCSAKAFRIGWACCHESFSPGENSLAICWAVSISTKAQCRFSGFVASANFSRSSFPKSTSLVRTNFRLQVKHTPTAETVDLPQHMQELSTWYLFFSSSNAWPNGDSEKFAILFSNFVSLRAFCSISLSSRAMPFQRVTSSGNSLGTFSSILH